MKRGHKNQQNTVRKKGRSFINILSNRKISACHYKGPIKMPNNDRILCRIL